jgi:hypothetical protein
VFDIEIRHFLLSNIVKIDPGEVSENAPRRRSKGGGAGKLLPKTIKIGKVNTIEVTEIYQNCNVFDIESSRYRNVQAELKKFCELTSP